MEVGPDYGRILGSPITKNVAFSKFLGEVSEPRTSRLKERYASNPNVVFVCGDIDLVKLGDEFDLRISSATMKHLYPTFAKTLSNISRQLKSSGKILFDFVEGTFAGFDGSGACVDHHSKSEAKETFRAQAFKVAGIDTIAQEIGEKEALKSSH